MTGQVDLIEEEILLSHEMPQTKNNNSHKGNTLDYPQSLTHNTDNDIGDQI